jgi:hypothetical protein
VTTADASGSQARHLVLASTSRAADSGYLAMADLAQIATELDVDYRIIGVSSAVDRTRTAGTNSSSTFSPRPTRAGF